MVKEETKIKTSIEGDFIVIKIPKKDNIEVFTERDVLDNNKNLIEKIITVKYDKENEDDETEFDNMDDEIDSALDLIADVVSSEELFVIEQKLKEKYGVK